MSNPPSSSSPNHPPPAPYVIPLDANSLSPRTPKNSETTTDAATAAAAQSTTVQRTGSRPSASASKRSVLKMTRPEKGVVLGLFVEHGVVNISGDSLRKKFEAIVTQMRQEPLVRNSTKERLTVGHVESYRRNYNQPLSANGGSQVPHRRDEEDNFLTDAEGIPILDMESISNDDDDTPGIKKFWVKLVEFDTLVRHRISSSDASAEAVTTRAQTMRARKAEMADRRREQYAQRRKKLERKRRKKEADMSKREQYKINAMASSLQTQQQNAFTFHALTSAYCLKSNQPAPPLLVLPTIPQIPEIQGNDTSDNDSSSDDENEDNPSLETTDAQ